MQRPLIWAVIGSKGSGKDAVAEYLAEKIGGRHFSCSQWLRQYAGDPDATGKKLWEVWAQLRDERGPEFLVDEALKSSERPLVISGLRQTEPLERVRQEGGVILHVEAATQTRHQRVLERQRPGEVITPVWTDAYVSKRVQGGGPTREVLTAMADYAIDNNGTLEATKRQVDKLLATFHTER